MAKNYKLSKEADRMSHDNRTANPNWFRPDVDPMAIRKLMQKFDAIASKLVVENPELSVNLKKVKAPAGLSINAITPDEIALSILAEITQLRRAGALSRENADV